MTSTTEKPEYMIVVDEIYRQLGGGKFKVMTGANTFGGSPEQRGQLSFRLPKAKNGINTVYITLTAADTYDIEFCRVSHRMGVFKKVVKEACEGIYNDQLQEVFTRVTGLYTRL